MRGDYMEFPLNIDFENKLIKNYAQAIYKEFLSHASR